MSILQKIETLIPGLREEKIQLEAELMEHMQDHEKVAELSRPLAEVKEKLETYDHLKELYRRREEAVAMESDPEMQDLAKEERESIEAELPASEAQLEELFFPKDPEGQKDALVEIRPGTGGEEAALFVSDLLRAYLRFAEKNELQAELLEKQETGAGGIKEVILEIQGRGAYGLFRFEGGVHRVQRIPKTESQGRIHTSAVSVVVMPKTEEKEFEILEADLRIDTFRSSGPGGQSVNTTDSAIRILHVPTGVTVSCQDQKSQLQNKRKALTILRSRLAAMEEEKRAKEAGKQRLSQIGSGDRSDKIRTYNFPQDRITDHRLTGKKNFSNIPSVLDGNLDPIVEELQRELLMQAASS